MEIKQGAPTRALDEYRFQFPEGLGGGEVVLREPSAEIELEVERLTRSANGGPKMRGFELLKRCIVTLDGKAIDWNTTTPDEFLTRIGPKKRMALAAAYNQAFVATDEELGSFLGTMTLVSSSG